MSFFSFHSYLPLRLFGEWPWDIEDENTIPDLKVKFLRLAVLTLLAVRERGSIVITGYMNDRTMSDLEDRIRVVKETE